VPVLSNITNLFDTLLSESNSLCGEFSKYNTRVEFVKFSEACSLLQDDNGNTTQYEVIMADAYLLTVDFWNLFREQLTNNTCKIKWIMCTFAGINAIFDNIRKLENNGKDLIELLMAHNVKLTKIGSFGSHMYEYLLQHMLNDLRNYTLAVQHQSEHTWIGKTMFAYKTLGNVKIGLLGYGNIGNYVCKYLKMSFPTISIYVYRNTANPQMTEENVVDQFYSKENNELIPFLSHDYDFLISIIPSTPETKGLLNNDILQHVTNKNCCFINVGRGDLISESSIISALDNKHIRKAVLDVFEVEPLPSSSALWDRPDVIITPHISALSLPFVMVDAFRENYLKFIQNSDLSSLCDWSKGY